MLCPTMSTSSHLQAALWIQLLQQQVSALHPSKRQGQRVLTALVLQQGQQQLAAQPNCILLREIWL